MSNPFYVTADIKQMFFDRQKVLSQVRAENRKRLARAGAFVRRRARTDVLLRSRGGKPGRDSRGKFTKAKGSAKPGQPPVVHSKSGNASLRYILFGIDSNWESVVIGPVALPEKRLRGSSAQTVPQLMEFGGTNKVNGERKRYAKHPFMGPSLDEEVRRGTISDLWSS